MNDYAIKYFKDLKVKYSKGRERKTEIRIFDDVDVKKVVVRNSKLYINGSEGFIGSHIVENLIKKNYKIRAFVYYNSFNNIGWLSSLDPKVLKKN